LASRAAAIDSRRQIDASSKRRRRQDGEVEGAVGRYVARLEEFSQSRRRRRRRSHDTARRAAAVAERFRDNYRHLIYQSRVNTRLSLHCC